MRRLLVASCPAPTLAQYAMEGMAHAAMEEPMGGYMAAMDTMMGAMDRMGTTGVADATSS